MKTYHVLKKHYGAKPYKVGDTRNANPADVAHLVSLGVLGDKPEADPKPKAKAKSDAKADADKAGDDQ